MTKIPTIIFKKSAMKKVPWQKCHEKSASEEDVEKMETLTLFGTAVNVMQHSM